MNLATCLLLILIAPFANAGKTENQTQIKTEKDKISITTKAGFHLNAEAPASVSFDGKESSKKTPSIKKEKIFVFQKDEKSETAEVNFYVCDDAKTVCEPHTKTLNLKGGTQAALKKEKAEFNDVREVSLKSTNEKPTLLVFSAPWCPACIRLQTETFPVLAVRQQLAKANFLKLNSDLADNYELSQKFKVRAIPTIILLDKNGDEIYRWLDFQEPKDFSKNLKLIINSADLAEKTLKGAQLGDEKSASILAHKAYNTLDFAEAIKWFSLTKSEKDQNYKLAAEVSLAQEKAETDPKLSDEYLQALHKAISLTTSRIDKLRWSIDYLEKKEELKLFSEEAKDKALATLREIDNLFINQSLAAKEFTKSTYGNYMGFEKTELLWIKSRVYKILKMTEDKERQDKEIIASIKNKNLNNNRPGEVLIAISYLREAGESQLVEKLYNNLIINHPESFVYFEKYARYAKKANQLERALELTNEALKRPQGNEPQLNLLKSQILVGLNKKPEALALVNETLKLEIINHKRFAGTSKRLIELKEELSK